MGKAERSKGLRGEREVRVVFAMHGWTMRGLEGEGDHIAMPPQSVRERDPGFPPLHIECKRQERVALPAWLRQAAVEAPPGTSPVVCFRQSRGTWYAALPLGDFLELVG